jgi:hypothetical protein
MLAKFAGGKFNFAKLLLRKHFDLHCKCFDQIIIIIIIIVVVVVIVVLVVVIITFLMCAEWTDVAGPRGLHNNKKNNILLGHKAIKRNWTDVVVDWTWWYCSVVVCGWPAVIAVHSPVAPCCQRITSSTPQWHVLIDLAPM